MNKYFLKLKNIRMDKRYFLKLKNIEEKEDAD